MKLLRRDLPDNNRCLGSGKHRLLARDAEHQYLLEIEMQDVLAMIYEDRALYELSKIVTWCVKEIIIYAK